MMRRKGRLLLLAAALLLPLSTTVQAATLSLPEAIAIALGRNSGLKIEEAGESAKEAAVDSAKAGQKPTVSMSANLSESESWNDQVHREASSLGTSVTGSLNLIDGGRTKRNIEAANLDLEGTRLSIARAQESVRHDVEQAFFNALEAERTVVVDLEAVHNYEAHLQNVQALYEAGSNAKMDVLRASVELANGQQELTRAEGTRDTRMAALRNVLDIDREEPLLLEDEDSTPFTDTLPDCLNYALQNRKDLAADRETITRRQVELEQAKTTNRPTLNASLGISRDQAFRPDASKSRGLTAGLAMHWNLFDGGTQDAAIKTAQTNLDIANLQLKSDTGAVDYAVRSAYYSMNDARERMGSTKVAIQEANEDYFIAREKYRVGEGIELDVIDAQLALSRALLNDISARYDYERGKSDLNFAMGKPLTEAQHVMIPVMNEWPFDKSKAQSTQEQMNLSAKENSIQEQTHTKEKPQTSITEEKATPSLSSKTHAQTQVDLETMARDEGMAAGKGDVE